MSKPAPAKEGCSSRRSEDALEGKALAWIIDEVYERSRIRLHEGKETLIRTRLGKRMRRHGFQTLSAYCQYLQQTGDTGEFTEMLDALTTNFTHFLREEAHFQFLVREALPQSAGFVKKRFGVWSAACATGEEPYSTALYLNEYFPPSKGWDWRILATDISTRALTKAAQGIFARDRLSTVPAEWLRSCFQKGSGEWEGYYRIKPEIAARIQFQHMNLLGKAELNERFEVILCRNVMIYFDRQTQEQLVNRLARCLAPAGFLVVGHSESLNGLKTPYRLVRPSIYQLS